MERRLEGQVAVITGGASGIGAATAEKLLGHGAKVVLGDIQEDRLARHVSQLGTGAMGCRCDVTREEEVQRLVDTAVETHGRIDVMFNNAGIVGAMGPMETTPTEEWLFTLDILLNGVFYGMKHASRHMKAAGRGSIVSMSSIAGVMGGLGPHAYAAAKHAVVGLTKNLAAEACAYGVRVNCLAPGLIATPLAAAAAIGDAEGVDAAITEFAEQSPLPVARVCPMMWPTLFCGWPRMNPVTSTVKRSPLMPVSPRAHGLAGPILPSTGPFCGRPEKRVSNPKLTSLHGVPRAPHPGAAGYCTGCPSPPQLRPRG